MDEIKTTQILENGLIELGLAMPVAPFFAYLQFLHKWNNAYNLTAIRKVEDMAVRHVLDSLAVLPCLYGTKIIDIGSGAGFPGIPLALTCPDKQFVLLDSNGKKTRFLQEVKRRLKLLNVEIVHARAEHYRPENGFDTVISRAFSDLQQMLYWTRHLTAPGGIWLAMKGRYPASELLGLDVSFEVKHYEVPTLADERCAVIIHQQNERT